MQRFVLFEWFTQILRAIFLVISFGVPKELCLCGLEFIFLIITIIIRPYYKQSKVVFICKCFVFITSCVLYILYYLRDNIAIWGCQVGITCMLFLISFTTALRHIWTRCCGRSTDQVYSPFPSHGHSGINSSNNILSFITIRSTL